MASSGARVVIAPRARHDPTAGARETRALMPAHAEGGAACRRREPDGFDRPYPGSDGAHGCGEEAVLRASPLTIARNPRNAPGARVILLGERRHRHRTPEGND